MSKTFFEAVRDALSQQADTLFPKEDWEYEVANSNTLLGFKDWQQGQVEHKALEVEYHLSALMSGVLETFDPNRDTETTTNLPAHVVRLFETLRLERHVVRLFETLRLERGDSEAFQAARTCLGGKDLGAEPLPHYQVELPVELVADIEKLCSLVMQVLKGEAGELSVSDHIIEMSKRHGISNPTADLLLAKENEARGTSCDPAP